MGIKLIWQAVVESEIHGVKSRQLVNVEANSFQQARELLLAQYGPESINVGPRQISEPQETNNE